MNPPMRSTHPSRLSGRHVLVLVIAMLLLGVASARAATIDPQEVLRPPHHLPVEFGGRKFKIGHPIPRGHVVLRRRVTLEEGEKREVTFLCPAGKKVVGPAIPEPSAVTFNVFDLDQYHPPRRRFHFQIERSPQAVAGQTARGRIYVLCRPA
jgi:hypothetical protein